MLGVISSGVKMIPSIETICEDLAAGLITVQQAIGWMNAHASGAANELRDHFAGLAMQGILAGDHPISHDPDPLPTIARVAYEQADAMLEARDVKGK